MQVLRLHDPGRRPASWTEIIQPRQFAAFAKDLDTDAPSDLDGRPFPDASEIACFVFDHQIFAGFVGLNLLLAGGRLLWFNLAVRETEDLRQQRMAAATGRGKALR